MSEPIKSLLADNRDLLSLAMQAPEKMVAWFDQWAALLHRGERDPRVREIAQIYRIGYQAILDHAAAQTCNGGKR